MSNPAPDVELSILQQSSNTELQSISRKKPGRKAHPMGYGNVSGKGQKGIYLSKLGREMLTQLSIVQGQTESSVIEAALREYFMRIKAQYAAGNLNWEKILSEHAYIVPKWQR